jgi:predicted nucleotidyltransferase
MDERTSKAIKQYIKLIRKKYNGIEKAILFGSFAKGYYNQNSDIDLALIFKELDESERFNVQVQLMLLASQIDSRIEPHPISHSDFYSDNPFGVEIQRTGVEISD